jgi:K+-sensing histidine kinase KdpD
MSRLRKASKYWSFNWWGYIVAIGLVALATWLKYLAQPTIIPADVPILYLLVIVPTAIFFGFGPAILVCVLSLLAYDFFFIPPLHQFTTLSRMQGAPILVIFLVVGVLFSYLASSLRKQNLEAHKEIIARKQSEAELTRYRDSLEDLVKQRTDELEKANLSLSQDITARQQTEEELRQRTAELEASIKELEAFSYSVSHDLRAPLRSMAGFSRAMLEDYSEKLDEQGKQYLRHIEDSSALMGQLIDDLLKLSRVTRSAINYGKVDLSDMAQKLVTELVKSEAQRRVNVVIAPDIIVYGDRNLLQLVLKNLLDNAWKFSSKVTEPRIEMGVIKYNGKPAYFIRDNGAGFDMTFADKLFQPFQRLHQPSEFTGTGIGLATVQRIIKRHGGAIWAESKVGEGSTFFFTLS